MLVFLIRYKYIMNQEYKGNVLLEDVKTIIPLASLCGLATVIIEEIHDIMTKKYGARYKKFL